MMRKFSLACLPIFLLCFFSQAQPGNEKFIAAADKSISYMGRIGHNDSCTELYWTGSSVAVNVKGTASVKVLLSDEKGGNYYWVLIDSDSVHAVKIKVDKEKKFYPLATNLTPDKHRVELFKITNTDFITTRFYGFTIEANGTVLKPDKKPKRKIEFFGNSITCGHGVEPGSKNSGAPEFFNNYRAYGSIVARHFSAQYHCTAKSGIGIMISWFNEVMPEIYDRLNPGDSTSKWNFKKYMPDIVVVNLFQNDSWLVNQPEHAQFMRRFGTIKPSENFIIEAYKNFIQSLRGKYSKAQIICCLGNMDATKEGSKWPGYIDSAVAMLHDKKITTHFFPYKGTGGHPDIKEQQMMADDLIKFIEEKRYW